MPDVPREESAKTCITCQIAQPLSAFARHRLRKDGRVSECKNCTSIRCRRWYRQRQAQTNRLYSTYVAMKQRCHNPNHQHYATYGGRGIAVCEEWKKCFDAFVVWATSNGYQPGLQIDRIDNDRGYSPDNCRFVTPVENARNKRKPLRPHRTNAKLTLSQVKQVREMLAEGVSQREIGRRFGVTHGTIWSIRAGRTWTTEN